MKHILTSLKLLSALALLALAGGCATTSHNKESALIAAGFKVITPSTPEQEARLKALPTGKVTMVTKKGKAYYVYPDVANNRAYVGSPAQYQTYQQNRQAQQLAEEQLEAAQWNANASLGFEGFYGWDPGIPGAPPPRPMMPPPGGGFGDGGFRGGGFGGGGFGGGGRR